MSLLLNKDSLTTIMAGAALKLMKFALSVSLLRYHEHLFEPRVHNASLVQLGSGQSESLEGKAESDRAEEGCFGQHF